VYQGKPGILAVASTDPRGAGFAPLFVYSEAMQGLHLTADLYQCRCENAWLTDAARLGAWCLQAVEAVGLQHVNQLFHAFPGTGTGPGGVTATVLLAESHMCLHTWPEQRSVTVDVYVCNFGGDHSAKARGLMDALISRFQPEWTEQRSLDRGGDEA
jgi:S-adenosylmethionine decarboxylase